MALKKKSVQNVQVRSVDTKAVITVSEETAEQLLRNKGEYELVKPDGNATDSAAEAKAAAKAAKKAAKQNANQASTPPAGPVKPEWPKGSVEAWSDYAKSVGIDVEGLDRNGIHSAVVELEAKNQ